MFKKNQLSVNEPIMWVVFTLIYILTFFSCAKQIAPTGGPKDEKPPTPIKSNPINYSKNFKGKKIIILFDEFVVLKDANQEVLVSPPLKEKPELKLRGKNILIKLNDTLKENTTYGINFYNAITDLNEGNVLKDFAFEFSTGNSFDSIYLSGNVKNAFNYKSEKNLYVMLYKAFNDSTPRTQLPEHIAKTDEEGNFLIANMRNEPYYIFALKDLNNNMLFDLPSESIAFLDSTFKPSFKEVEMIDTLVFIDSISPDLKDTVFFDSVYVRKEYVSTINNVQLLMFQEDFEQQFFRKAYRPERQQVVFAFNRYLKDSISVFPFVNNELFKQKWFVSEKQSTPDSLVYWITDSTIFNNDSLKFQLNYTMLDSNKQNFIKTDTLTLFFEDIKKKKEKKKKKFSIGKILNTEEKKNKDSIAPPSLLTFTSNANALLDLNKNVFFISRFPIKNINDTAIRFVKIVDDTVEQAMNYSLITDSMFIRQINLKFKKDENEKFKLLIPAGSFTDIYNNINDTLEYEFSTQKLNYYGTIKMEIVGVKENSIVQLLNNKEEVMIETNINTDTVLNFKYLNPQKYSLKLFYDTNNNKKWDTGNYKKTKQAELVFYFDAEIEVISNFDYDYKWELYPIPPPETYTKTDTIRTFIKN